MTDKETVIRIVKGDETSVIKIVGMFEIELDGGTLRVNPYNSCEDASITTFFDRCPVVTESGSNYLRIKIIKKEE